MKLSKVVYLIIQWQTWINLIGFCPLFSSATSIQHISVEQTESRYAVSGTIVVNHDGWGHICCKGSKKKWGKREAVTACKQLGYLGGWHGCTYKFNITTNNLNNFDCDKNLSDLENCEYEVTELCKDFLVATITCYGSFEVNLIDGETQNIGKVRVKYDEVSSDVCYTHDGSNPWNFYNAQVACRELGYPGAMFERDDNVGFEKARHRNTIGGYECKDNLRENSLQNCHPDVPNHADNCSGVITACAKPGYFGCFDGTLEIELSFKSVNMTINICRRFCRDKIYRYALLSKENKCSCTSVKPENPVGDTHCQMRCCGDNNEVCGDDDAFSGYYVTEEICDDPLGTKMVYFFGDIFTLKCIQGTEPANQASIQCVWDNVLKRVTWNSTERLSCKANDIENVAITEEKESPYSVSAVLTVQSGDKVGYICYYGSKKHWGGNEATTACRQLGYTGGWPTIRDGIDIATYNLENFDCNQYEVFDDLNSCKFDVTTGCERSKIAGIQCYNSFQIKQVNKTAPHIGKIQVKFDKVVSDVCYTHEGSKHWTFDNTQVVCRQLGYPGAMFYSKHSDDYQMEKSTISGYVCPDALRIKSIEMCNQQSPTQYSSNLYAEKSVKNYRDCSAVIVACALPGYVGCYNVTTDDRTPDKSAEMTINRCRHYCRFQVTKYAFIFGGDTCFCQDNLSGTGNPVGDAQCKLKCTGDSNEICGDETTASVYDVKDGLCSFKQEDFEKENYYFLGEFLECNPGSHFARKTSIQCILDDLTGTTGWNSSDLPICQEKSGDDKKNLGVILLCVSLVFVAIAIVYAVVLFYYWWHSEASKKSNDKNKSENGENDQLNNENV